MSGPTPLTKAAPVPARGPGTRRQRARQRQQRSPAGLLQQPPLPEPTMQPYRNATTTMRGLLTQVAARLHTVPPEEPLRLRTTRG